MNLSELVQAVEVTVPELRGFQTVEASGPAEAFGDELLVLLGPDWGLRLVLDRGQFFLDLCSLAALGQWLPLEDLAALGGEPCPTQPDNPDLPGEFAARWRWIAAHRAMLTEALAPEALEVTFAAIRRLRIERVEALRRRGRGT